MKRASIQLFLTVFLIICALGVMAQMPSSPCGQAGGKRADVLGVEARYSSPGASAPVFTIPAGTKSISVYVSSETGVTSGGNDYAQGDEDFLTINAIIDLASNTSSGYVNYAKSTYTDGSGTNLYGWQDAPLGSFIPATERIGDALPELNNVNFTIQNNTLTITQSNSGVHSSFYVQYLSPYNNSLNLLEPQVTALLHGTGAASTDLVMPIPAGADIIFISGKGTNSSSGDLNTTNGTEEGYSNLRFTIDLQKKLTSGFVTLANGGSANRRSTYAVNNLSSTYMGSLVGSGLASGDYTGKTGNTGAVGFYNPAIYISGNNLVIKRNVDYARDFDDAYVVEFYKRAGTGMSAEFVSSDIKFVPTGLSSTTGVSRTFSVPPGTNAVYFTETGNAVNTNSESNENSLEAYAYIDLAAGTATGYFYQQVGLSGTERRDDNYAFKGVPLNNSSTRSHPNTVGFKGPYNYDISFSLSADKSQLTVTNKTGLANPDYQLLLSIDNYGSKPDLAFGTPAATFTKYTGTKTVKATVTVCNPGAGNSTQGVPFSVYHGNPTTDPQARLLHTGTFPEALEAGQCKTFSFDLDLQRYDNLNIDLTIVINDNGSYVAGGVGSPVGTVFSLTSLASQHAAYQECFYGNNLVTQAISVNNAPVIDPDPNKSSGVTEPYSYLDYFDAGSSGIKIMDSDVSITDPDAPHISGATITLTNHPDAGSETLFLNGTLPGGITISGNNTNVVELSGQAPLPDYIAAMKMLEYRNSNKTPAKNDRIITAVITDGTESSPVATTTIVILTDPRIDIKGNSISISDNSTEPSAANGTDFGMAANDAMHHSFSIHNVGTGVLSLTASPALSIAGEGFSITTQPASASIASAGNTTFVITYDPAGRAGGTHTAVVRVQNNDQDADRADYTFTVSATVNILPVVKDNSVTGKEDQTYAFSATDFTGAYSDGNGALLGTVKILNLPGNGALLLNGAAVAVGAEVSSASLEALTFVPGAEWNGVTGFDWNASDGTAYATAAAHLTINIAAINDAPAIQLPASEAVTEDVPFAIKDVVFSDVDAAEGNVRAKFTVAGGELSAASWGGVLVSESTGTLLLDGKLADINSFLAAGKLFYSAPQASTGNTTLIIKISDNGNTGSGGALEDMKSMTLGITAVNDAPAGTGDSKITDEDTPVSGVVTGTDADGDALVFSKATDPSNGSVVVDADGSYTYAPKADYVGTDKFTVTVSDGNGGTATITVNITVAPVNDAPTGSDDTKTTPEDTPVSGTVVGKDADGDKLTFTKATNPANGTAAVEADGSYTYTPAANYTGTDKFTVTVDDGNGGTTIVTVNVTISPVNDAPAGSGDNKTTHEDTPVSGALSGTDVDGDALVFSKKTDPANGSVVVDAGGSYSYTPNADYVGSDEFTVTLSDGNGGTATVTVNITISPLNDAPTGSNDFKTTPEDTPVSGTVTGKDADGDKLTFTKATDPANGSAVVNASGSYTYTPKADYVGIDEFTIAVSDGNGGTATATVSITVSPVNDAPAGTGANKMTGEDTPVSGVVTGTDPDEDVLSFARATDPLNGTAIVNTDGNFTYTPNAHYHGTDNFTVTVNDGKGGSATVQVNITVTPVNDVPAGTGDVQFTKEETPVSGTVTGKDADGDALTFSQAAVPANGTITVNNDGSYTYTPNKDFVGVDKFTINISDGNGGMATVPVNITVAAVNDAPEGTGDSRTTDEDTPVTGVVTGKDVDGDDLTFTSKATPLHGAVVVQPDGRYTYTPDANYNGKDNFTVIVSDGNGGIATVTVNIDVLPVNDVPSGTGDSRTTNEDVPVDGAVAGADADGDELRFTLSGSPAHGAAAVNTDGTYTYTPEADYNGPDRFAIDISDGHGGIAKVTVNITVTPVHDVPTGRGDAQTTPEDTPVSGKVTGSTGDRVTLVFSQATAPVHGSVAVNADGTYLYTPKPDYHGQDNFTVTIADKNGGSVTVLVNIVVTPVNDAPSGKGDDRMTLENTAVKGQVTGADIDGDALSFNKATDPAHGSVVINIDGSYVYTPATGYSGPDNFIIQISDGKGGTVNVTVNILVNPVMGSIALVKTGVLQPDNMNIFYTLTVTNTGNVPLHNVTITDPMLGLNRAFPGNILPGAAVSVTAVYKLTQEDRERGSVSNTAEVTGLTPANREVRDRSGTTSGNNAPTQTIVAGAPQAMNDAAGTRQNTPVTVPVLDNDNAGPSSFNRKSIRIMALPWHGQVLVLADGRVTYIPENSYSGDDAFTYRAEDVHGYTTNIAAVNITVETDGLQIPTLFTPNGDGKNDVFEIRGLQKYEENELVIVNRWGNEVYRQKNYQGNWKGDGLSEGTYYYLLRVKRTGSSGWEVLKGFTTLLRKFK